METSYVEPLIIYLRFIMFVDTRCNYSRARNAYVGTQLAPEPWLDSMSFDRRCRVTVL